MVQTDTENGTQKNVKECFHTKIITKEDDGGMKTKTFLSTWKKASRKKERK